MRGTSWYSLSSDASSSPESVDDSESKFFFSSVKSVDEDLYPVSNSSGSMSMGDIFELALFLELIFISLRKINFLGTLTTAGGIDISGTDTLTMAGGTLTIGCGTVTSVGGTLTTGAETFTMAGGTLTIGVGTFTMGAGTLIMI